MKKPDPDMFGRLVMTDLATIYAEVARNRMILEMIARHLEIPNIEKKLKVNEELAQTMALELSSEALRNAGFESPETGN